MHQLRFGPLFRSVYFTVIMLKL